MPAGEHREPPRLPLPDPLLARRALREMRNAMRHGFSFVRDGLDQAPLPAPVAAVTGSVLRKVDVLAHRADAAARTLVDGLLGPSEAVAHLDTIGIAALLREAVGTAPLRVDEAAVRRAIGRAYPEGPEEAARLMVRLLEAGAVRPAGREASVAIFSAVLAMLQAPDEVTSLPAGVAIAEAVADEIAAAGAASAPLARLFDEFRDHV